MIVFAVDNTYQVFQNEQIENITNTSDALYVALQYFLLGVSSIYMVQNILLIGAYFPGRDEFFNEAHFKTVSETNKKHIERYSKEQVSALHSFYCILFAAAIFGLNYYFENFPPKMQSKIQFNYEFRHHSGLGPDVALNAATDPFAQNAFFLQWQLRYM